jgi:hypothetical protein
LESKPQTTSYVGKYFEQKYNGLRKEIWRNIFAVLCFDPERAQRGRSISRRPRFSLHDKRFGGKKKLLSFESSTEEDVMLFVAVDILYGNRDCTKQFLIFVCCSEQEEFKYNKPRAYWAIVVVDLFRLVARLQSKLRISFD